MRPPPLQTTTSDPCVMMMLMASSVREEIDPTVETCLAEVAQDVARWYLFPLITTMPTAGLQLRQHLTGSCGNDVDQNDSELYHFARTACYVAVLAGAEVRRTRPRGREEEEAPRGYTPMEGTEARRLVGAKPPRPYKDDFLGAAHEWIDRYMRRLAGSDQHSAMSPVKRLAFGEWVLSTYLPACDQVMEATTDLSALSICMLAKARAANAYTTAVADYRHRAHGGYPGGGETAAPDMHRAKHQFRHAVASATRRPCALWAYMLHTVCTLYDVAIHEDAANGPSHLHSFLAVTYEMLTDETSLALAGSEPGGCRGQRNQAANMIDELLLLGKAQGDKAGHDSLHSALDKVEDNLGLADAECDETESD